jgi:hypothetical protein
MAAAAALVGAFVLAAPLTAATAPISLSARPTVVTATNTVALFGRLSNGATGQTIQIEMSQCNGYGWLVVDHTETGSLGAWGTDVHPNVTTKFRARWRNSPSNAVTVRARPDIFIDNHHHARLLIQVRANDYFKRALLERRAGTRWLRVKTFALGRAGPFGSGADLHLKLARGTRLRVSLSQAQVGRCYLPASATTVLS